MIVAMRHLTRWNMACDLPAHQSTLRNTHSCASCSIAWIIMSYCTYLGPM